MKKLITLIIILIMVPLAYAATVSHTADQVVTGTFPGGLIYSWLIWPDISTSYMVFNTTHLQFNESYLNATIDARNSGADTWNTTTEMIDAVNNTALNGTLFYDLLWANLLNIPADLADGDDDTTYSDLSEFNNDVGYYYSEANLTTLLDDNYADISVVDTNTWNTTTQMFAAVNNTVISFQNVTIQDCQYYASGGKICSG